MKLNYDELLLLTQQKEELYHKVEIVDGREVGIFSYHLSNSNTFDNELSKWCRGTVFDIKTKTCICRPFKKFFNLNEHDESKSEKINWENIKLFSKLDGSIAMPVLFPSGKIYWKSNSSFHSVHTIQITVAYGALSNSQIRKLKEDLESGYTPIYEFVSPKFKIVLSYPFESLIYLGKVHIESGTYYPNEALAHDVPFESIYTTDGIEGYVCWDGKTMFKQKTEWYLIRHKAIFSYSKKALVTAILSNSIDDVIGVLVELDLQDRLAEVNEIRDKVVAEFLHHQKEIDIWFATVNQHLVGEYSRKDFAAVVRSIVPSVYVPFMFSKLDDKDIIDSLNRLTTQAILEKI